MLSRFPDNSRFMPHVNQHSFLSLNSFESSSTNYGEYIRQNLCSSSRIINYQNKENIQSNQCSRPFNVEKSLKNSRKNSTDNKLSSNQFYSKAISLRQDLSQPEKILDAPEVKDDFYLNNIDWNPNGPLAIGLEKQAYVYTPSNTQQLLRLSNNDYISSIKSSDSLAFIGISDGKVKLFDMQYNCLIRELGDHQKRVSTLCISNNSSILYSGSKDKSILVSDIRIRDAAINKFSIHRGQVCSLQISPEPSYHLASGSNDNRVGIWDIRKNQLFLKYREHKGAVKGISWCPWRSGVIATAGGAGDRSIRVWNINDNRDQAISITQSQISSLIWSNESKLLISSHGNPNNQINFWDPEIIINKTTKLEKIRQIKGHTKRILKMCISPSQDTVCTLSADETLRFWKFLDIKDCNDAWKKREIKLHDRWSVKLK